MQFCLEYRTIIFNNSSGLSMEYVAVIFGKNLFRVFNQQQIKLFLRYLSSNVGKSG